MLADKYLLINFNTSNITRCKYTRHHINELENLFEFFVL